jgi:hypothetical protein
MMSFRPWAVVMIAVIAQLAGACEGSTQSNEPQGSPAPVRASAHVSTSRPRPARVVRRPKVPAGMTVGYVVFDRRTGRVAVQYNARHRFRSASVVKILIALDYLRSRGARAQIPIADLALLRSMLRSSNDDAATALWKRAGRTDVIRRMTGVLKLTDTLPPPAGMPGFWGYTGISAADVVRVYRYLLAPAHRPYGDFILGNLRRAAQCAADGFDQYFGIPRALPRPWAIKQGWSGYGSLPPERCVRARTNGLHPAGHRAAASTAGPAVDLTRPVLHTTGTVGAGDRQILVVLSLQPAGASWHTSTARLTAFTKAVYRAVTTP